MLLKDKKVLITGGSQGIGRGIVTTCLEHGASVYYIGNKAGDAYDEYTAIARKHGQDIVFRQGDVSDEQAVAQVVQEILDASGGIDVLVNNAGITRDGLIFRMSIEDWNRVLAVNLTGAFNVSKPVAQSMIKRRAGSIINISSIVGVIGNAGQSNYCASKAGLIGFTKGLAREVAGRGVRVNALAPGFVDTAMTDNLSEDQKEFIVKQIPMKRTGSPQEIANVCLFLASDLSSYMTGEVIHISGGMGM